MQIGEKIRKIRELKGLKQENIATALGMSITAYGNLERGDTHLTYDKLEEIAKAMEVTVQDIINIPEQFNIQSITNSQVGQGYNHWEIKQSEMALEGYKQTITELQSQVEYLKRQNDTLLSAMMVEKNKGA
jgi:transcriptional regulator with XRE-family HTH domain